MHSSHSENATLKKSSKEEMDAIHQYLDNIRNLSGQKEQLAKELEDENQSLKSEMAQRRLENEALLAQIQQVTKLTSNIDGLQQQLTGKTIKEQIKFFLEERSNYITKLEELENELQTMHNSKSSLQQQLTEMQTKLEKQKAALQKRTEVEQKNAKSLDDLKKSHEKEKFEVLQKYFKINTQMGESKQKIAKLEEQIKSMKEDSAAVAKQHQIELQKAKTTTQGQKIL